MMNKVRRLFRGSSRILAIIFAASIIWLIFDMAALRFSFSEINSRVSREELVRLERLRAKVLQDQELHKMFRKRAGEVVVAAGGGGRRAEGAKLARRRAAAGTRPPASRRRSFPPPPPGRFWNESAAPQPDRQGGPQAPARSGPIGTAPHPGPPPGEVRRPAPPKAPQPPGGGNVTAGPAAAAGRLQPDRGGLAAENRQPSAGAAEMKPESERRAEAAPDSRLLPVSLPQRAAAEAEKAGLEEWNKMNSSVKATDPHTEANDTVKQSDGKTSIGLKVWNRTKNEFVNITDTRGVVLKQSAPEKTILSGLTNATQAQIIIGTNKTATNNLEFNNQTNAIEEKGFSKDVGVELTPKNNETFDRERFGSILNDSVINLDSIVGVHKVLAIDMTLSPRDPKAIGQFGQRSVVPKEHEKLAKEKWSEGHFNVYLSNMIPLDRAIPDTRPEGCSNQVVHNNLPTTSIIMCFVDEVWSTLLRSVHSIFNRSPAHLIKEVILVDDFSTKEYLKENLDKYMTQFPKVHVIHLQERHGLIRARLVGATMATGDVLTFLDSHVECNVGWLEPLLEIIHSKRTKVACPVIEVISDEDMSYVGVSGFLRGVFTWPMNFEWKAIPDEMIKKYNLKEMDPIRCPIMAGGLFSIDKKYFYELGTYDAGLEVWGGENMELSFKVWMCGGEIEIIPCSRVGHIFRDGNPYTFPKNRIKTVERNLARVAEVWLDEYVDVFYGHGYHHLLNTNNIEFNIGDLRKQKELRKKLQCKSFKWYLENVYPDLQTSLVRTDGLLFNVGTRKCLAVENGTFSFEVCDIKQKNQHFSHSWLRLIKQMDMCIALLDVKQGLGMKPCDKRNNNLRWFHRSFIDEPTLKDHILWEISQFPCV
ncbi:polypeptide N-acetylgalactosaminyltransferase 5 [Scyliorhinus canicula]|uniref:polypeptide N-acetylgalactosaminyltransferase 5 n=1 Tax=Scyliorhinus canicula TaxID=7830 RepID=UPI0018F2FBF9|nr:polypeptide N-acetylgalactosaminyltransferase 5 [Scyliorhinus canicula]